MPWIEYTESAKELVRTTLTETASIGSDGDSSSLKFKLAQYAINGTFLGFTDLRAQLSMCPMSY